MVKAYLRYEHSVCFGVVASTSNSTARIIEGSDDGETCLAPALEAVHLWHLRKGTLAKRVVEENTQSIGAGESQQYGAVTSLCRVGFRLERLAVGHANGAIRMWDLTRGNCETSLNGHRTAVSCLAYCKEKSLLASGGRDSDLIVWDVVADSGICRLKGHKNEVTSLAFLPEQDSLLSCGKDACIRVWNLTSQHCTQVVTMHRGEIWSMDLSMDGRCLVTGSLDEQLLCFRVKTAEEMESETDEQKKLELLEHSGTLVRRMQSRIQQLQFDRKGVSQGRTSLGQSPEKDHQSAQQQKSKYFGVLGAGKVFELYKIRTAKETLKKTKRKLKRKREKQQQQQNELELVGAEGGEGGEQQSVEPTLADEFNLETTISVKHKIKSFYLTYSRTGKLRIVLALASNSVEVYEINPGDGSDKSESLRIHSLDSQGHRGDVRALSISNDNSMILSCSYNGIKVWNANSGNCLRTCAGGYGLSCTFVVGDKYACVGTKSGDIEVYDISFGGKIQVIDAHEQAVWSIRALPDSSGLLSVSGDGNIKFWEYGMVRDNDNEEDGQGGNNGESGTKALTLEHKRSLKMPDDVLCVAIDNNGKYIAIGMIDTSLKIFFADTLKFYLSLYGHKLPVLCCDISSDGTLLASGSADKNLKIWGMDFGDCHKSLFAHTDSVTQVKFVPKTHYLFTSGKDGLLKYWDADKFELLLELKAHHSEIWTLAVSSGGEYCVTGSHDTSIRRWERTEEAFFLEEEKEKRLETMFDTALDDNNDNRGDPSNSNNANNQEDGVSSAVGKKNQQTVSAADSAIDALDIASHEMERLEEHEQQAKQSGKSSAKFVSNPLLLGMEPRAYVYKTLKRIKSSDLEQALILLPFNDAVKVLSFCEVWLLDPMESEFTCKIIMTLVRIHLDQIQMTHSIKPLLTNLQKLMKPSLKKIKSLLGTNKAAMSFLKSSNADNSKAMI
jgi:U3 small nucleolar RNA-associated protein 12